MIWIFFNIPWFTSKNSGYSKCWDYWHLFAISEIRYVQNAKKLRPFYEWFFYIFYYCYIRRSSTSQYLLSIRVSMVAKLLDDLRCFASIRISCRDGEPQDSAYADRNEIAWVQPPSDRPRAAHQRFLKQCTMTVSASTNLLRLMAISSITPNSTECCFSSGTTQYPLLRIECLIFYNRKSLKWVSKSYSMTSTCA